MTCMGCEYMIIDGYFHGVPFINCGYGMEGTSFNADGMNYINRPDKFKCPKEEK